MRSYKAVIQQAELLLSPPETVAEFLKSRAADPKADRYNDPLDAEFESALRDRGDPLISLSLARYGLHSEAIGPMFAPAEVGGAIRLALLSNTVVGKSWFSAFPIAFFGDGKALAAWLPTADGSELNAMFENPSINESLIRDLLERKEPWDTVPDEVLCTCVAIMARNPRMKEKYDDSHMDGYAEYTHNAVFNAGWELAGTVPVNQRWSIALSWLYNNLCTDAYGVKEPLEFAKRWVPTEKADVDREAEDVSKGHLAPFAEVRKGLARLAISKDQNLATTLLSDADPALRSAAYAVARMAPEGMAAAYEKDGELFFMQGMHNPWFWRDAPHRQALHDIAWAMVKADKNSDLMAANIFNGIKETQAKEHPDWFKDEDMPADPEDATLPATKADVASVAELIVAHSPGPLLENVAQAILKVNARLGWVFWFALGGLVVGLFKH